MKILPFAEKYMDEMATLFMEEFSKPGFAWDLETAKNYLALNLKRAPQFCFMALSETNECLGAVFCQTYPFYQGTILFIDELQVKKAHRQQDIAKALLKKVVAAARKNAIDRIQFLLDENAAFPKSWYQRLGFYKTNWMQYEAKIEDIKL